MILAVARAPSKRLVELPRGWFHDLPGPVFGRMKLRPHDNDLTRQHAGPPQGERILLNGRVLDSDGRGVPGVLIEIWQTNASGAYVDAADPGFVPLDLSSFMIRTHPAGRIVRALERNGTAS